METLLKDLKNAKIRKHIVTSIEYDCKTEENEEEIFEMVHALITEHTNDFAKITYDIEPDNKVKVEVIENK
jgi:hypothetical protein